MLPPKMHRQSNRGVGRGVGLFNGCCEKHQRLSTLWQADNKVVDMFCAYGVIKWQIFRLCLFQSILTSRLIEWQKLNVFGFLCKWLFFGMTMSYFTERSYNRVHLGWNDCEICFLTINIPCSPASFMRQQWGNWLLLFFFATVNTLGT